VPNGPTHPDPFPSRLRQRLAGHSDVFPQPPNRPPRRRSSWWPRALPLAALFLVTAVIGVGAAVILLFDAAGKKNDDIGGLRLSLQEATSGMPPESARRLLVDQQMGFTDEPLPLGLAIRNPAGDETVTLTGLAAGTIVAPGAMLETSGWQMPGQALAAALAYPPRDFVGVMEATVRLLDGRNELLDSRIVRLVWIEGKPVGPVPAPAESAVQGSDPTQLQDVVTVIRRAEELLKEGDFASARLLLKRALDAVAGFVEGLATWEIRSTVDPARDPAPQPPSPAAAGPQPPSREAAAPQSPKIPAARKGAVVKAHQPPSARRNDEDDKLVEPGGSNWRIGDWFSAPVRARY
jgi:hypothetical protein